MRDMHQALDMNCMLAYLYVVVGYVLLSGEFCVLVRLEHVIPVPGDTVVVGDKVGVKSA